jgi:outer membrane biosynthesis protein TonB
VKRFSITLIFALSSLMVLSNLAAQDPAKPEAKPAAPAEAPKPDAPQAKEVEKAAAKPEEAKPKVEEAPLKPITPEVEAKLEAARKAVAELIVEAEDAGLVETTIDQPPILDLLITGRATDLRELKKPAAERLGVSPEVFGAWFTGHGKKAEELSGLTVNPQTDVRIIQPVKGLSDWYEKRTNLLNTYVAQARAAKAAEMARKADEAKKAEEAKPAEPKKEEAKSAEPKKEEAKPAEPKKEEAKPAEPKKEEAKPAEAKKDEPKA